MRWKRARAPTHSKSASSCELFSRATVRSATGAQAVETCLGRAGDAAADNPSTLRHECTHRSARRRQHPQIPGARVATGARPIAAAANERETFNARFA